ncbi:unnamed protein product [Acanthoscelides obtectus]|uniref:Uncharacterized protein n=1 Tax=Acanthoscelides obtectus TaxID=200917 RepID=A0A9P0NUI1_ACAOB|nr:unnamed protein product [Acanthoscelides obtectus]CAK1625417.1 hypothetical protein AOBTE_LOCUS3153 [Acanthoscelides obtectus]
MLKEVKKSLKKLKRAFRERGARVSSSTPSTPGGPKLQRNSSHCNRNRKQVKENYKRDLKKKLIESKIMALKNEKDESKTASNKKMSTVKISEINFTIEPGSGFFRDYWMIAVTHNDDLYMSEPMMPDKDGKLSFKDEFTVFDFEDSLDVQVEVFSIRLHGGRADDDSANCSEDWCNLSFYDDFKINGSRIVKSSFQSCGKFTLTAKSTKSSFNKLTSRMLSDLSAPLMLNKLSPTKLKENIGRCLSVDMLCTM